LSEKTPSKPVADSAGPCGPLARFVARHYLKKPELESLLGIKYPTWKSMWHAARNEFAFRRRSAKSHRITQLNVELTNRCNLSCVMCPVNHDMERERHDLDLESFKRLVDENRYIDLILMFQWGESLLVNEFYDCVRYATDHGIRVMVTSNGTLLTEKVCGKILDCGLERITFSVDGGPETHQKIRGFSHEKLLKNVQRLIRMRDEGGVSLGVDVNMTIWEENEGETDLVKETWEGLVDRLQFIPRFADAPRSTPCRELWRGALVVHSNGNVVPCCRDVEGVLKLGDARETPLGEIWNGETMRELRARHRNLDFPPICANCSEYETEKVSPRFS
jgi:radical SAM protein with 4Fe4S-binding SPASM domain